RLGLDAQMRADEKGDRVGLDLADAATKNSIRWFQVGDAAVQQHVAELVHKRGNYLHLRHLRTNTYETVPPGGEALSLHTVGPPHGETGALSEMHQHRPGRLKIWRSARPRSAATSRLTHRLQTGRPVLSSS